MSKNKIKIFGHRGAAGIKIENTIESFSYALAAKVDFIELDVWKTKDNEIIVFHDSYLDRLTTKKGKIAEQTLLSIKQITLSNGEKIPTLNEVIEIIHGSNVSLLVEVKSEDAIIRTFEILKSKLKYSRFIIGSFFHENIMKLKNENPTVQTSIMFEGVIFGLTDYLEKINPNYVTTSVDTLNKQLIEAVKNQNRKLILYTINTEEDLKLAIEAKPYGIVTNYPDTIFLKTQNGS